MNNHFFFEHLNSIHQVAPLTFRYIVNQVYIKRLLCKLIEKAFFFTAPIKKMCTRGLAKIEIQKLKLFPQLNYQATISFFYYY